MKKQAFREEDHLPPVRSRTVDYVIPAAFSPQQPQHRHLLWALSAGRYKG